MVILATSLFALVVTALSLAPSFAHVLEAPPRLLVWSPDLWRDATVFNGQFALFAKVGAPLDLGAIIVTVLLSYLLRRERPAFWLSVAGAVLLAAGLATWFGVVAPVNAVLATWRPGPIPGDFNAMRIRWEAGHMAVACFKLLGFVAICLAVLARPSLPDASRAARRERFRADEDGLR